MQELPRGARYYLACLHIACLLLLGEQVGVSLYQGALSHLDSTLILAVTFCIVLGWLACYTELRIKDDLWQNLAAVAGIGGLLLFAQPLPMLITFSSSLLAQAGQRKAPLVKRAFNVASPALGMGLTELFFSSIGRPNELLHLGLLQALPGLIALMILYYGFDISLMLGLMVFLGRGTPWQIWRQFYRHTLLPELGTATVGILAAIVWRYNPAALALLVAPLIALRGAYLANARAEAQAEALRQRSSQLEKVLAVGQYLRLQHTQEALLQAVAEAACTILSAQTVTGYVRDEEDSAMLRRVVLAPSHACNPGPAALLLNGCESANAPGELRLSISSEGAGIAALLMITGIPEKSNDTNNEILGILATQTAIALQNAHLHDHALALAARDSLTDLLNRRTLQDRLLAEVIRALRGAHPLCLLMIDLDDFSVINNTYGHHAGDGILRAVARIMREGTRPLDIAARYGGDEFVLVLPETNLEDGLLLAERLGEAITLIQLEDKTVLARTTASIGVAALAQHGHTPDELLRAADQAAYAAKHAGKGRVARPEDAALALDRDPLVLAEQLAHANMATVAALAAAVDAKDPYTQGHSQRVSHYAAIIAQALELAPLDVARIQLAGQLHDVGKIGVADTILIKPGKLSAEEYKIIQQHPVIGERMLADVPFLREILPAVRHHHERWDGRGYPDGLCASQIPFDALILAVADSFDAMTSSRTYRAAMPLAEARRRINEGSGIQFAPHVVHAFERAVAQDRLSVLAASGPPTHHAPLEQAS